MRTEVLIVAVAAFALPLGAQEAAVSTAATGVPARPAADASARPRTPAEREAHLAETALAADAKNHRARTRLAMALARRARETADPAYYARALAEVARVLEAVPGDPEAEKVRIWAWLGQHRFEEALAAARALNRRFPDDLLAYGFIVDGCVELGRYKEAEEACQWMLDLRPGNVPGMTRAAYLRELFGDVDGALELMQMALDQTREREHEDRAWILTHMAHLRLAKGDVDGAAADVHRALALFADYHYALAVLAEVHAARGAHEDAVSVRRRHCEVAPHPENRFRLAQALERAGRAAEAAPVFAAFEEAARAESASTDNANRELVRYYLDHAGRVEDALALARAEAARRQDVFTRHLLAWALFRAGSPEEAGREIEAALAVGIKDAEMLFHAALIAEARGEREAAAAHADRSLAANPRSEVAEAARALRSRLLPR